MLKLSSDNSITPHRVAAIALSFSMLVLGLLYYVFYRQHALVADISVILPSAMNSLKWNAVVLDKLWLPSFTHAFASLLCLHAVLSGHEQTRRWARAVVVVMLFSIELLFGTFDYQDMLAIALGLMLAETTAWALGLCSPISLTKTRLRYNSQWLNAKSLAGCSVITVSALLAAGSYVGDGYYTECAFFDDTGNCTEYKQSALPVYMSYKELRESVRIEAARPPDRLGRVYLYQNYVFLNERNEGIHIIDNSEPTSPVNLGFIRVPGNTEIAIRDNYLYADSYVDLITLDLNDPTSIQEVNRQEDIFPYDGFQNIPYNVSLNRWDMDPLRGVIVSYQLTEN